MRRFAMIVLSVLSSVAAFAEEILVVSAPARRSTKDGKTIVEVFSPSQTEVHFIIRFERKESQGETGPASALTVVPARWAVCISESQDVWFYDGDAHFLQYKITGAGVAAYDSHAVPNLRERAPNALKQLARKKDA